MGELDPRALEAAAEAACNTQNQTGLKPYRLKLEIVKEHWRVVARAAVTAYLAEAGDEIRRAALEEAAVIAETWFDHHRPQQPKKSRFDIYDIEHWAKSATRLVAEDIRARAMIDAAPPAAQEKK
jgi:hypothetical protein